MSLDLAQDTAMLKVVKDNAFCIENTRLEGDRKSLERYTYHGDDLDTVCGEISSILSPKRDGWSITTVIHTALRSTVTEFRRHAKLDGYEGEYVSFLEAATKRYRAIGCDGWQEICNQCLSKMSDTASLDKPLSSVELHQCPGST